MSAHLDAIAPRLVPAQQHYFVDVPGTPNAAALSVVSFELVERLGEPYRITVELTHPDALSRQDYLGKDATFSLAPEHSTPRRFQGCITRFDHTKTTHDFHAYRFVIEPHVARLRLTEASRIFQHQTAPQIIEAILRRHGFKGHQFAFKLRRAYPEHAFRLQYRCSDWNSLRVLMEQHGLYSYVTEGEHGDQLIFGDDIDHYLYQPALTLPYRESTGLETASEAILTLATHTKAVPKSFLVADYNPDQAWERFKAEANAANKDTTTYGQPYVFGTGHLDQAQAQWEAQLRHEAAFAAQVTYHGESTSPALCCACVVQTHMALPEAPHGMVIVQVTHTGARDQAYRNTFEAIPADRRFRLPLNESAWPTIPGTLSARVTSPSKYKYAYLTKAGEYVVRFDLDFDAWNPGGESVPLRLAKPFAGKLQTGMHFPALDGDEAVVAFRNGDPNRPYIAAFHHHSQATDLITNQDRWMSRNVIRTQSDNKLQMEDWEGQEHVKLSTEHSGKSQLTLGHMVNGRREKRGEGVELRTSGWAALRGGKGIFITADDQPSAKSQQLEMQDAVARLEQALQRTAALSEAAEAANAVAADYDRQKGLLHDTIDQLKRPGMLLSAPGGIALASGADLQLSAEKNLILNAGQHTDVSVLKRFTVAAGELVSVFAQKLGIKLIAAKGPVEIQAQSDALQLRADQQMTLSSANGRTVIEAKTELLLKCGGSYLRITSTGIEDGTRGDRTWKAAAFYRQEVNSLNRDAVAWPSMEPTNRLPARPLTLNLAAAPAARSVLPVDMPYKLLADGVLVKQGLLDDTGLIPIGHRSGTQTYRLELANDHVYDIHVADAYRGDVDNGGLANQGFHFHEGQSSADSENVDRAVNRPTYAAVLHPTTEG